MKLGAKSVHRGDLTKLPSDNGLAGLNRGKHLELTKSKFTREEKMRVPGFNSTNDGVWCSLRLI
jgi:hypothetical protein